MWVVREHTQSIVCTCMDRLDHMIRATHARTTSVTHGRNPQPPSRHGAHRHEATQRPHATSTRPAVQLGPAPNRMRSSRPCRKPTEVLEQLPDTGNRAPHSVCDRARLQQQKRSTAHAHSTHRSMRSTQSAVRKHISDHRNIILRVGGSCACRHECHTGCTPQADDLAQVPAWLGISSREGCSQSMHHGHGQGQCQTPKGAHTQSAQSARRSNPPGQRASRSPAFVT